MKTVENVKIGQKRKKTNEKVKRMKKRMKMYKNGLKHMSGVIKMKYGLRVLFGVNHRDETCNFFVIR